MSGVRRVGQVDQDWLLAAWEWAQEVRERSGCGVQVSLRPTSRRGVWSVTVRVLEAVDGKAAGIRHQVHSEWPNSSRSEFLGHLNALMMQADFQTTDEYLGRRLDA